MGSDDKTIEDKLNGADSVWSAISDAGSRRTFLKGLGAAGVGGMTGLAGCTGGGDDGDDSGYGGGTSTTTTESGSGETETGEETTESSEPNVLRVNAVQRFGTIDPAKGTDYTQTMALVNLYDPLVFPDTEGTLQPHLAEEWTVSDDSKTYTFTLRDGVTFHSGNPVRAEDVVFSLERFFDINQGYSSLLTGVLSKDGVTAIDDRTVEFALDRVHAPFLASLVLLFIVDKKDVLDNAESGEFGDRGDYGQQYLNSADAGSGAYSLGSFERQAQISFQRYDEYWQEWPEEAFDEVRIRIITEDPTVRSLVKTGELDMTSQYQSQETYTQLEQQENIRVETIPTVTMFYFKLNTQKPPVDDPAVREAMAYGFDYETARTEIASGSLPAQGPLAPSFGAHNEDLDQPTYQPEKAKQILEDAGYSDGDLTISNTYVKDYALEEKMGLLFQQNMDEIGIDVELNPQTWGTMTELATSVEKTPHVNQVFYGPVYPSPYAVFFNQYHSEASETWISMEHLQNDEIDAMIDDAKSIVDSEARAEVYKKLQTKLVDLHPDLFIFVQSKKHAFDDEVAGYEFRPSQSYDYWFHDFYSG